MASLRILLADDHEAVRRVLTALLGFHPGWEVCGEAADGREAVAKVAELKPHIVLLDSDMPNLSGLEAARQIVQDQPSQKVLILTMADTEPVVREVFEAGALGFVLKRNATHDLVPAIEALQQGRTYFTPRFAELILQSYLDGSAKELSGAPLTERERETLQLLTRELAITVSHPWRKPSWARRYWKRVAIIVIVVAAGVGGWFAYNRAPAELPWTERLQVGAGLKPGPAALFSGNPDTRVWIDVHTALYYCRGAEQYGRTSGGRFARQHDAQEDHFEPAARKACE
jgi:DNA-binding NarL/FixJ family response regulator